jgi:hypothetical protein
MFVKVWLGFCAVDAPPSPKDHNHAVGAFLEVSVNATVKGATPRLVLMVKEATGGALCAYAVATLAARAAIVAEIKAGAGKSLVLMSVSFYRLFDTVSLAAIILGPGGT